MKVIVLVLSVLNFMFFDVKAQNTAVWNSETEGVLNGVNFTVSSLMRANVSVEGTNLDLSSSYSILNTLPFSAAGLSSDQQVLFYETNSQWRVTFDEEVTGLRLYASNWPKGRIFAFDELFTVLSGYGLNIISYEGLHGVLVLQVDENVDAGYGIIEFPQAVKELNITVVDGPSGNIASMTFSKKGLLDAGGASVGVFDLADRNSNVLVVQGQSNEEFFVTFKESTFSGNVDVIDITGRVVYSNRLNHVKHEKVMIKANDGLYFMVITEDNGKKDVIRIVK